MNQVKRLLVLEGDQSLEGLYKEELEKEGYQVTFAAHGREGHRMLQEDRPDLVILDLALFGTDGLQVLGWLVEENKCLPVIMNSKDPVYPNQFMGWAADASLVKSYDLTQLKKAIRSLLKKEDEVAGERALALSGLPAIPSGPVPSEVFVG
jgi:DNA-binding response OmpR family regulator